MKTLLGLALDGASAEMRFGSSTDVGNWKPGCLSDGAAGAVADGKEPKRWARRWRKHLKRCRRCCDFVTFLHRASPH